MKILTLKKLATELKSCCLQLFIIKLEKYQKQVLFKYLSI